VIVVADASVLISLSRLGHLGLLHQRFPEGVWIPPAVWQEVVEQGAGRPGAQAVSEAEWITVHELMAREIVHLLEDELDAGETEAIALANEAGADIVLLDERDARRSAKRMGLRVLGTVGLLIWAKQTGRIPSLRQVLDELQNRAKFRLSQTLYEQALDAVGER
jgi:uncharacterized protein